MKKDIYYAEELFLNSVRCPVCNTKINTDCYEFDNAHLTTVDFKWGGGHDWIFSKIPFWTHSVKYCHVGHGFITWKHRDTEHDIQREWLGKKDIFRFVKRVCHHEHDIIDFIAAEELIHNPLSKDEQIEFMVREYESLGIDMSAGPTRDYSQNEILYAISKSIKQRINIIKYATKYNGNEHSKRSFLCETGVHKYAKTTDPSSYLLMCKCGKLKLDRDVILDDIIVVDNMK